MGGSEAPVTVETAAYPAVWLALENFSLNGQFINRNKEIEEW